MTSKTRYEETPASELPPILYPVDVKKHGLPKENDKTYLTNYGWLYFHNSKFITEELIDLTNSIKYWYDTKPSEPQAVSKSIEEAAINLFKSFADFKDVHDNPVMSISSFIKAILEFSQQQQQGQDVSISKDTIDFVNWLHVEGYEWGNKRYQLYLGGKYYWIKDVYQKYLRTPPTVNKSEPTQGNEVRELVECLKLFTKHTTNNMGAVAKAIELVKKHTTTSKEEWK